MAPHMASISGGVTENNIIVSEDTEASQMSNSPPSQQVERGGSVSHTNEAGLRESGEEQRVSTQVQNAENQGSSTPQVSQRPQLNQLTMYQIHRVQQNQEALLSSIHNVQETLATNQATLFTNQATLISDNKTFMEAFTRELGRVEDHSNAQFQEMRDEFDEKIKPLQEAIVKMDKAEKKRRREKIKQEKDAGKPKKVMSLYNAHVQMISKMLKEQDSKENLMKVSSRTWKEMSREDLEMRRNLRAIDKERYEREYRVYLDRRSNGNVDERKPAAKPTPEELVAADAVNYTQESSQLGQEGAVDVAAAGSSPEAGTIPCSEMPNSQQGSIFFVPGIPGTWHDAESVLNQGDIPPAATANAIHGSQGIHQHTSPPAAAALPVYTASPEDENFPREDSNSQKLADPIDVAAPHRLQGSFASLANNRNTEEMPSDEAHRSPTRPRKTAAAKPTPQDQELPVDERKPAAKPSPQEYAAAALADGPRELSQPFPEEVVTVAATATTFHTNTHDGNDNSGNSLRQAPLISSVRTYFGSRGEGNETEPNPPPPRTSPTEVSQNLVSNDDNSATQAALQCPVGHRFIHSVKKSCYHDGYECEAVVVKIDGDCEYYHLQHHIL